MSSKNLKVYKIVFLTEIKFLNFNVKFPCQIKVSWKRSNQSVETKPVALENHRANINQTLKLNINMYYDTTTSKFVEKKCIYNVLIITEKGQKAAGSITYDLAQFFNKRIYQIDQEFPLSKCPVEGTMLKMKIYYEQSTQAGYDSMSKISVMDHSSLNQSTTSMNQIESLQQKRSDTKSKQSSNVQTSKTKQNEDQEDNYSQLNQSQIEQQPSNMKEKILAVADVTSKIQQFVQKVSTNLKYQIQTLKMKNKALQEEIYTKNAEKEIHMKEITELRSSQSQLKKQFSNYKDQSKQKLDIINKNNQDLAKKLEQSQKLCAQLQSNMSEKGQSQSNYIKQIKDNFSAREAELKKQLQTVSAEVMGEKKIKNELQSKIEDFKRSMKEMKEEHRILSQKNQRLQEEEKKRQSQLQKTRIQLDNTYQKMVKLLGDIA